MSSPILKCPWQMHSKQILFKWNQVTSSAVYSKSWMSSLALGKKQPLYSVMESTAGWESHLPSQLQVVYQWIWPFGLKDWTVYREHWSGAYSVSPGRKILRPVSCCTHRAASYLLPLGQAEFSSVTWRWVSGMMRSFDVEQKTPCSCRYLNI